MKIYVLTENTLYDESFECENGLSLYIETKKHNILVDTGTSDVFLQNAEKLGIDLSKVDICVLTHGHNDHSGGLIKFFEMNKTAKVYANVDVFGKFYMGENEFVGLSDKLKKYKDRFIFVDDEYFIDESLELFSGNDKKVISQIKACGYTAKSNSNFVDDDFHHEHYLIINEKNGKKALISGCSHKGINNIMHWVRYDNIDAYIGGIYLLNLDVDNNKDKRSLDMIIDDLLAHKNTNYYVGHCVGEEQYNCMKQKMGERLNYIRTGQIIEL
ncbi:MAG: MBL fold metallo-hydrolase [Christensenellaceae bacterium]|nr:MBL fold metallo-hydrolase [Christensenellaceae bacterium]